MIGEARASVARRVTGLGTKSVSTGKKVLILVGFCTAQLLDVTTTHIGLAQGRQEMNGIAAWIIQNNGELAVYALKLSLVAALGGLLLVFGRSRAVRHADRHAAMSTRRAVWTVGPQRV